MHVENFRCVRDATLSCDDLTVMVGPNGSGKSSFLAALRLFYEPAAQYSEDDFYDQDTLNDISIAITFTDLTDREKHLFEKRLDGGELTVQKILTWPRSRTSQKYFGMSHQSPEFYAFRSASGADLRREYDKLRSGEFPDLPKYTNKDGAEQALQAWEETHLDKCERRRDEGQFFGFKEVGETNLERFTRFIFVPAVREASHDAAEGRGTPLTEIMDLVVRNVLAQRKDIAELQRDTQKRYEEIVNPAKLEELHNLQDELSSTLKTYVPDAGVKLNWLPDETFEIPMPKADIRLLEDEYPSSVERTGHGLQRAFILTMLQHLAVAQSRGQTMSEGDEDGKGNNAIEEVSVEMPNLILGIEEPELYQHPNRQRHLSKILLDLATGKIEGVAEHTQILYSTHSPLFVDIRRFDKVRALRKAIINQSKPRETKVIHTTLDNIARTLEMVRGCQRGSYSAVTLRPRLQTLMTPWMNEGFFANVAVLVEGEEDRAAILGTASAMGHDLESLGISVIPCNGKTSLDRPAVIFGQLEIPVFVVWDSDRSNQNPNPELNHMLLRLFAHPEEDWPDTVSDRFACFEDELYVTLRNEIGTDLYDELLNECCRELHYSGSQHAKKNPLIVKEIITRAQSQGRSCGTLERIVESVLALKKGGASSTSGPPLRQLQEDA